MSLAVKASVELKTHVLILLSRAYVFLFCSFSVYDHIISM
jgi:hypothetical protein